MKITLNGQVKEFKEAINLHTMIEGFCQNSGRIIAEVNGQIIKRPLWAETTIKDADSIELVSFVGGG